MRQSLFGHDRTLKARILSEVQVASKRRNQKLKNLALLNSNSNATMFCNERFARCKMQKATDRMVVDTNGIPVSARRKCNFDNNSKTVQARAKS